MKLFRKLRRRLQERLPPCLPTRVYFRDMQPDGYTKTNHDCTRWIISIRRGIEENSACETLAHEWAHAVADIRDDAHDAAWGIVHSEAWKVWESVIDEAS